MPDDPLRDQHENALRFEIESWLKRHEAATLLASEQGAFDLQAIPHWYWSQLRQSVRDTLYPHLQQIQYNAALRLNREINEPINPVELMGSVNQAAGAMAEKYAMDLVGSLRESVEETRRDAENAGVALAVILAAMLADHTLNRMSIGLTTNAITEAERVTVNRVQAYLDDEYRRYNNRGLPTNDLPSQPGSGQPAPPIPPSVGQPAHPGAERTADRRTAGTPGGGQQPGSSARPETGAGQTAPGQTSPPQSTQPGRIELVAIWRVQMENGRPDAKVCPICFPLNGKPESQWPDQYKGGPQAHPNCRCYLDWEFWMDGKRIMDIN